MEEELRTNAVRKSPEKQHEIRKSIIRLANQGRSNGEIAETLDVSERHVRATKKTYAECGLAGLRPRKRGRKVGEKRRLTSEQEKEIQGIIVDKTPEPEHFLLKIRAVVNHAQIRVTGPGSSGSRSMRTA